MKTAAGTQDNKSPAAAGSEQSWGRVFIILHWLVAAAAIGLFILGLWMTSLSYYDAWYNLAPHIHKSVGIMLFATMLLRLVWRLANQPPVPLPEHADWEKKLAKFIHPALYALLFALMISGYLISTADGRPIEVFNWFELGAVELPVEQQEEIAGALHFYLAWSLIVTAILHTAGALKHHFLDQDDTLRRMLRSN